VTETDSAFALKVLTGMVEQVRHEADLDASRGQEAMVARLVPQIPIREHEERRSWLGGEPAMPARVAWPEAEGRQAVFLAQICCADLPGKLWDGLGPRQGWLAFFLHPVDYRIHVLHLTELGPWRQGPAPDRDGWFGPAGGLNHTKLPHQARQAFPRWPVDIVAVTPGSPDPCAGGDAEVLHRLYREGYDLASPEHYPFDWTSTLAMLDIAEERINSRRDSAMSFPGTLPAQLETITQLLRDAERAPKPPENLERLRNKARDLPILIEATGKAASIIREAASELQVVAVETRDLAGREPFSQEVIRAVMQRLRAIEWMHVKRGIDKNRGEGAEDIQCRVLPLTVHDPDATLWVHDFETLRFDWAKHAYCRAPASLPPAVRAHFEWLWRELAPHEMASMGHIPFKYVHEFDSDSEVTLLELPSSGLMSWMFGDVDNLVLTMKKADLAAGNFGAVKVQFSN
jgi:hypothetical protein